MSAITKTTQLKVTVPVQLQDYLKSKADKFGLTMSSYIKNLIMNDVKDMDYPIYKMSDKSEASYLDARKAEGDNNLVSVKDFDNLV